MTHVLRQHLHARLEHVHEPLFYPFRLVILHVEPIRRDSLRCRGKLERVRRILQSQEEVEVFRRLSDRRCGQQDGRLCVGQSDE